MPAIHGATEFGRRCIDRKLHGKGRVNCRVSVAIVLKLGKFILATLNGCNWFMTGTIIISFIMFIRPPSGICNLGAERNILVRAASVYNVLTSVQLQSVRCSSDDILYSIAETPEVPLKIPKLMTMSYVKL